MHEQTAIPCLLMRGGTSKGPYFNLADLPADPAARDRVRTAFSDLEHALKESRDER